MDGSPHDWLEGRGSRLTLIASIDDATNEVPAAVFREQEDAAGYFIVLRDICKTHGLPMAVYADRHTIFQSPKKATIEQPTVGPSAVGRGGAPPRVGPSAVSLDVWWTSWGSS